MESKKRKYYPYNKGYFMIPRTLMYDPFWIALNPIHQALGVSIMGRANHTDSIWMLGTKPIPIRRGQLVTSLPSIQKIMGNASPKEARTALDALKNIFFLTWESFPTHRIITIINYDAIQDPDSYKGEGRPSTDGEDKNKGRHRADHNTKKGQTPSPSGEPASKGRPKLEKRAGIQECNSKDNDDYPSPQKHGSEVSSKEASRLLKDNAFNGVIPQVEINSIADAKVKTPSPHKICPVQTLTVEEVEKAMRAEHILQPNEKPTAQKIQYWCERHNIELAVA